jgi:Ca2+-binding RTX toxin-like protein
MAVTLIQSDLQFILDQILISEAHAAGAELNTLIPNVFLPWGLRTVDGSYNNLVPGQQNFGASGQPFPTIAGDPVFRDDQDGDSFGPFINTNYAADDNVVDADPRIISNLIVDQTINNPAAVQAFIDGGFGVLDSGVLFHLNEDGSQGPQVLPHETLTIPNTTPDEGLSAGFNTWFIFFGQFFDHGLDFIERSTEIVVIPLLEDDPLFVPGSPTNFMVIERTLKDADGNATNLTTPFVDQNQTYTSHPSHQVFLREYVLDAEGHPVATGELIKGADGGMATWADVKLQAAQLLGIELTDLDVGRVPLVLTDAYGRFIPGANGLPQLVATAGGVLEGDLDAVPPSLAKASEAVATHHAFIIDIAHTANPRSQSGAALTADSDSIAGQITNPDFDETQPPGPDNQPFLPQPPGTYDNELLNAHLMAGDGRANENIALSAVHHIFHSEHNRLADHVKEVAIASNNLDFLNQWLRLDLPDGTVLPTTDAGRADLLEQLDLANAWDGERIFQAARFGTEMQYQHLVFEEFARKVQPNVDAFLAPGYDATINPAIVAEFAHTVYRFGHSMLTETIDRFDPTFTNNDEIALIEAFLNPLEFSANAGLTADVAAGAIVRGTTRQLGNEIDEFVTEALRNNLLGLPLDLATINLARGREAGVPALNAARAEFFAMTGDSQLKPYESWADFAANLKHPESVINFIAAYGTHSELIAADVDTVAEKRAVATALVLGGSAVINAGGVGGTERTFTAVDADRLDFLNAIGSYAGGTLGGLNLVDLWIGGLAERQMPFGGLLGSTFNFVFETQMEALQNGDRFYYLARTAGLNFLNELENNSFAKLIMANTDVGHLPADVFSTPAFILEVDEETQFTGLGADGRDDPTEGGTELRPIVIRGDHYLEYTGEDHVVLGGTDEADILIASIGDDTIWGDGGNDRIEGGDGVDNVEAGAGDDIITDLGGDDILKGNEGNDVIHGGNGFNLIIGGPGQDFIITGEDVSETFGGTGNDFILGAKTNLPSLGNEGDDWIELGTQDGAPGDNFDELAQDLVSGHDVFVGGGGFDEMLGEGGDDIFVGSEGEDHFDGDSGFDWVTFKNDPRGITADMMVSDIVEPPPTASNAGILDRYAFIEGLSGSAGSDHLRGDDATVAEIEAGGSQGSRLTAEGIARIAGLDALLGDGVTTFAAGNIILGGSGSDIIEGRGGNDIIDGDSWLNVRISVRQNPDGTGPEIASFNSMTEMVSLMLDGTYNPGQLQVVREILSGEEDFDTVVFSGLRDEYSIAIDVLSGVVVVTDNIVGRDGTDRLLNVERLQFNDQVELVDPDNDDNNAPVGTPVVQVLDADGDVVGGPPVVGQAIRIQANRLANAPDVLLNVSDADNVATGGQIRQPFELVWQSESETPGIFEDIILEGGDRATTATGVFVVPTELTGLLLRAKIIYQDENGVLETVFSAPTAAVAPPEEPLPVAEPLPPEADTVSPNGGVHFIRSDLQFMLEQIKIAERHSAGEDLTDIIQNSRLPFGLRTVDGSFNNLVPGQENFGASDQNFTALLDQVFRNEVDEAPFDTNGPGPGGVTNNTNYATDNPGTGNVIDSDPRTISNLIVDQTANNPAAVAVNGGAAPVVSPGPDGVFGTGDDKSVFFIGNTAPDEGLSAGFNAWMTFFGQFFDHGLDLVNKGGEGTIFIPLQPDDPLYVAGSPTNFMVLTRATNTATSAGADGQFGTADDIHRHNNQTTPFVDQNQTYTSDPSHQVFLREYVMVGGRPVDTGRLLEGEAGGLATWADIKHQAQTMLGINLTDADITNVPGLVTDLYGNFIRGSNGFPQLATATGPVQGNPAANGGLGVTIPANAGRTSHAFLDDIAHTAAPVLIGGVLQDDDDTTTGNAVLTDLQTGQRLEYDDELLDAHFITGDGRGNENIGLTAVHHVFHSEHNRLAEHIKDVAIASNDLAFLNEWLRVDLPNSTIMPTTDVGRDALLAQLDLANAWDGARLFQAARFGTEMQYQHLVFEEFARKIQPQVDVFFAPTQVYDTAINPAILAEFAHVVYRFGHSMLTETVDRFDADFNVIDADPLHPQQDASNHQIGLIAAFLNPLAFAASGDTADEAAGAIVRGTTRQLGNEIDEFVTEALRNNLVGLPLDLPAINLARGRDVGVPSLNAARREFHEMTGDSQLKPYVSWVDFMNNLKHPESLINFIAAYGTHSSVTAETTLEGKRAAAFAIVTGTAANFFGAPGAGDDRVISPPTDRLAFLQSTGTWANTAAGVTTTGLDLVDLWIGGLAERKMPFGGFLGSTFNFVFETQMEMLQDGDRFYYLDRTNGLNFLTELENNSFAKLIMANTDAKHLPGDVFSTPAFILEVNAAEQFTGLGASGRDDPDDVVIRDTNYLKYTGEDHVVLGGTAGNDVLTASIGDDTVYGDGGDDTLEGGDGNDFVIGGAGDDIMTDRGGDDNMQGGDGNDVISAGNGIDLVLGGYGNDFIITGEDESEAFGGVGNDFILGTRANEAEFGNEGDDWIQGGMFDGGAGDNFDSFAADPVSGNDIFYGDSIADRMDGEGGDDIMMGNGGQADRYEGMSGFDWASFQHHTNVDATDTAGVSVDMRIRAFDETPVAQGSPGILTRFEATEGLSGSQFADVLQGDDATADTNLPGGILGHAGQLGSVLTAEGIARITGLGALLNDMLDQTVTTFFEGNIILGGGGSDIISGHGGNDLIDGDYSLEVYINADGQRFDDLTELVPFMLNGTYNPGDLVVVRQLVNLSDVNDFDTATFAGNIANYTITNIGNGEWTITDNVGDDGIDTVRNIERLQFADQAVRIGGINSDPTGLLAINDTTPTEDQLLTASLGNVADLNGLGPISYVWQTVDEDGVVEDIIIEDELGGESTRATGTTFRPGDAQVGLSLRVKGTYVDLNGVTETVFSAPTVVVENINDDPVGVVLISDATPTASQRLVASHEITDDDGTEESVFTYQWQQSAVGGGGVFTDIAGATGEEFLLGAGQVGRRLQVVATYTDDHGTTESVTSAATGIVGNFIAANPASQTLNGTDFDDIILGGGGTDTINGGLGNDTLDGGTGGDTINGNDGNDVITGGAGNDTINGGAGSDLINYTIGDGAGAVVGGTSGGDVDTLAIIGTANSEVLDVILNGGVLTTVEGGSVAQIESITADLLGGADGLSYGAGTNSAVTVNLALGTASGFSSIAGIENVTGGSDADLLVGNGLDNALTGGGGNDTLIGGLGADTLSGGAGTDTASYVGTTADLTISLQDSTGGVAGEDIFGSIENVIGGLGDDSITGSAGSNQLEGGEGADRLRGGAGSDTLLGGGGDDTIVYGAGDGNDALVNGGGGDDTFQIVTNGGANSLNVTFNGAPFTTIAGIAANLVSVEHISADLGAGIDTLTYSAASNGVSVNLGAHTASGFSALEGLAINNIENVTGGGGNDELTGDGGVNLLGGGVGNDTLTGGGGNDTLSGGAGNDTFFATEGGDGNDSYNGNGEIDTYDLSLTDASATITATSATSTDIGTDALTGIENIVGSQGNDSITMNGGNNVISGAGGNDTIIGGAGTDTLSGGADNDTFVFTAFNQSGLGAAADLITDFQAGDVIDLSALDAITGGGNQAFDFIGSDAFTLAGQLRAVVVGGTTIIQANTNANTGTVEFELRLTGTHGLTDSDFIL